MINMGQYKVCKFFFVEKSRNLFFLKINQAISPKLYRSYYLHRLRDSSSPFVGFLFNLFIILLNSLFNQRSPQNLKMRVLRWQNTQTHTQNNIQTLRIKYWLGLGVESVKNITRLPKTVPSTCHSLLRCQDVLTNSFFLQLCYNLFFNLAFPCHNFLVT